MSLDARSHYWSDTSKGDPPHRLQSPTVNPNSAMGGLSPVILIGLASLLVVGILRRRRDAVRASSLSQASLGKY